jgi:hypothetical protein
MFQIEQNWPLIVIVAKEEVLMLIEWSTRIHQNGSKAYSVLERVDLMSVDKLKAMQMNKNCI